MARRWRTLWVIVGLCVGCVHRTPALPSRLDRGQPLAFELPDLEGHPFRLSELRGSVVLVEVWATWCVPCERSFPFYQELHREWRSRGFEVVAVSIDERVEEVRGWVEERNLPFVFVHDPEGAVPERIGLRTMPSAVVVDREGNVAAVHAGFEDGSRDLIRNEIAKVLERR